MTENTSGTRALDVLDLPEDLITAAEVDQNELDDFLTHFLMSRAETTQAQLRALRDANEDPDDIVNLAMARVMFARTLSVVAALTIALSNELSVASAILGEHSPAVSWLTGIAHSFSIYPITAEDMAKAAAAAPSAAEYSVFGLAGDDGWGAPDDGC